MPPASSAWACASPGAQLRQLRQCLSRVLTHPHSQQLVNLSLNLRRRRYCTSHGVGLLQLSLTGLIEGTYAVAMTTTGEGLFTALLGRHPGDARVAQGDEAQVRGENARGGNQTSRGHTGRE